MDAQPRKISESRYARCILIYSVHSPDPAFSLDARSQATAVHRRVQRTQGCQVRQTKYRISDTVVADAAGITEPPSLSPSPSPALRLFSTFVARSFALDTKLLRKLTILFREQVERRLYESGRAFGISIGSEGIHIGAAYDHYQAFPSSTSRKPSQNISSRLFSRNFYDTLYF